MKRPNRTVAKIKSDYVNQYNAHQDRKSHRKKRLMQRLVITSVIIVITFGVILTYHVKQRSLHAEKKAKFDELTEQLSTLEKEEKELLEEVGLLNDDEYILDIARTNYFLSKKGELIFQLEDETERSY